MPEEFKNIFLELRNQREKNKETLEQVSRKLKIQKRLLESIEKGDLDFLPKVYARAMIKKYALYLGLEPNKFLMTLEPEPGIKIDQLPKNRYTLQSKKFIIFVSVFLGLVVLYLAIQVAQILLPPRLTVTSPQDNLITSNNLINTTGWTDPNAQLFLNNERVFQEPNGGFQKQVVLQEGVNELNFSAANQFGKTNTVIRRIIYQSGNLNTNVTSTLNY